MDHSVPEMLHVPVNQLGRENLRKRSIMAAYTAKSGRRRFCDFCYSCGR
jgi:hypothetical protein